MIDFTQIFDFTADDLVLNRQGNVSERQLARLSDLTRGTSIAEIAVYAAFLVLGALLTLGGLAAPFLIDRSESTWGEILRTSTCAIGLGLPMFVGVIWLSRKTLVGGRREYERIQGSRVAQHCGTLTLDLAVVFSDQQEQNQYTLQSGGHTWMLTETQYEALKDTLDDTQNYCVYWMPMKARELLGFSGEILSVELVS